MYRFFETPINVDEKSYLQYSAGAVLKRGQN